MNRLQQGLTLVELLAGLLILAITATLAVPGFATLMDSQRRQDTAQQLSSGLRMARTEAILRGQPVAIQGLEKDWSRGWNIFIDPNRNGMRDPDETLLAHRSSAQNVKVVGNGKVVSGLGFDNTGRPLNSSNGTLAVCLKDARTSHYQVVVAVTGRVSLRRDGFNSEPCA